MTMIENIARAISKSDGAQTIDDMAKEAFQQSPAGTNARTLRHARIALTALLEPSDEIVKAGEAKGGHAWDYTGSTMVVNPKLGFQAMIQAALDEPTTPPS